jgi:hypothetical protein
MVDLVTFLVKQIVDEPDEVKVDTVVDESGLTQITVSVAPTDMGKVIGRGGKIINAIRELVKVKAIKTNQRVRVTLADPATQINSLSPQSSEESPSETA